MASLFGQSASGAAPVGASATGTSLFGNAGNNNASTAGSLFGGGGGANNGASAPSGGLFGGAAASSAPSNNGTSAPTGLFGGGATSSAPTGGSLFGGANNNNTSPGASLFGGAATGASSAAPSLFGGGASTTAPGSGGLFGAAKPATPAGGNSLFGGNASTAKATQPLGGSLFGGQAAASQAPSAANNASLFSEGILNKQDSQPQPQADPNAPPPNPAYFDALLQRGRKRQTDEQVGALGELPQLQLGLQDISRKVRNLGRGGPSAGAVRRADARAHYLLSASGVNTGQALRDLDDLTGPAATASSVTPADLAYASGVKETLAQKYQNDFQRMVASHVQKAQDDFNRMIEDRLHGVDWDAHRQRIYEHFGLKKPQTSEGGAVDGPAGAFGRSSRRTRNAASLMDRGFGVSGMTRSVIGTPGVKGARTSVFGDVAERAPADGFRSAPEDRAQRIKQQKYADQVRDLNVARIGEKVFPIMQRFSEVETEPSNEAASTLAHAYKALIEITGEDSSKDNAAEPGAIKERQYAADYLDDNVNSAGQTHVRKRIINGARTFMEKSFFAQLEQIVGKSPREANVGGVPNPIAKVKGYVRVRASRKELGADVEILQEVNGDYCWPVLFYTLRCGLYREALEYVEENAAAFRQIDRSFMRYLRAYVASEDHRLPADMQTAINNEYSQRSRLAPEDSIDPYRMVCYRIVGRCELQRRSLNAISNDMMDWLWFQFAMAREYSRIDEFAHEAFGLDELRATIKDIGEKWFGPGSDVANAPTLFFFMQIAAGMFEKAVADLYAHNYVAATHFAIALDFYGLLRVSDIDNSSDLLTYTTRQQPQIAFGSLVGLYTRDFRTADATAAVDYLALICLNKDLPGDLGKRQRELCHQALTEVVLETRDFAQLLGDVRNDGRRIKGAIEQRLRLIGLEDEHDFLRQITLVAARTAEEQSRAADASLLYHLGEDYDKVLQVINEALSVALTTDIGEEPPRIQPLRPRSGDSQGEEPEQERGSLSLTAVDDPIELARTMSTLYSRSQMYYGKIRNTTKESCMVLLRLAAAREALEKSDWPLVIDCVTSSRVLPTEANGNMTAIRGAATAFAGLPAPVSRTVGYVLLWTVVACARNADRLNAADYATASQQATIAACRRTARDVMLFAGLIRFKLPGRVWEALAQMAGEMGVF